MSNSSNPLLATGKGKRSGVNRNSAAGIAISFGDEAPLDSGSNKRAPDKRRVSLRWLSGTVLTGLTSTILMGGALYAALDGRQQLAQPANIVDGLVGAADGKGGKTAQIGDRPASIIALQPVNERILQVPTVTKVGNQDVIRKRPFAYASAPLAVAPQPGVTFPGFNPLTVFRASGSDKLVATSDVIYGADVESEVTIEQVDFPLATAKYEASTQISDPEAEQIIRQAKASLTGGEKQVYALAYLDDARFALKEDQIIPTSGLDIKIIAENVTTAPSDDPSETPDRDFVEEVVSVPTNQSLTSALSSLKLQPTHLTQMLEALVGELGSGAMAKGTKLRVAIEQRDDANQPNGKLRTAKRISVYRAGQHIKSVAVNDEGSVVWGTTPAPIPAIAAEESKETAPAIRTVAGSNLPTVYDGIYRAALSQGLTKDHARRVVRTVAFDVDFRKKIVPSDDLEIFYSIEEGSEAATSGSEILYIGLTLSGEKRKYYRFKAGDDGSVDYYDASGKSAKKFLLRKPVPNARFGSPFGRRRHPISRTYKMHWGVDFSAPRGTPILAAGNGVIEQAKWNAGYGRQIIIRHANGYKSSYSHMHRFAKGMKVGARVRQGQIIGQVGSTGYSTGPHLHYEVIVNGSKVNPIRIRLPKGRVLSGTALANFKKERDRIDALLEKGRGQENRVAALN